MTRSLFSLVVLTAALALPARAGVLDDDLAVVRHAVAAEAAPTAGSQEELTEPELTSQKEPAKEEPAKGEEPPVAPRWLRVRVQEKGSARPTVSVNLPLSLLRALTDEEPLEWLEDLHLSGHGAIGRADDLVTIQDEDTSVRVWLE